MQLLKEVIKDLEPSLEEEKAVSDKVNEFIKKLKIKGAKAVLGGSGAKDTWIKGQFDADIFVMFDSGGNISDILEKTLVKNFKKVSRVHGSRDYFQIYDGKFLFEIIPIKNIKKAEDAQNITDVSPLHAKWVKKKINKTLGNEIRLAKQFCRAQNIYGAESYIQGFSGYICEILVIYYGSFTNLLKNSNKWKKGTIIDIENYWKNKNIQMELNKSKIQSPLIVIDPVQKDRNAAAALSLEKFQEFKSAARKFLKKPSLEFFVKKKITIESLIKKAKNKKLIVLDIEVLPGKNDVIGSKLLKSLNYIQLKLIENDFNVIDFGWTWNKKAMFYFIIDKKDLEEEKKQIGPPMQAVHFVMDFKKKHKKVFLEKNKMCAMVKRDYVKAEDLVKDLIKDENVKNRIKKAKITVK